MITVSLTDFDLFTVLRGYLLTLVAPGVEVVRGQVNRVPQVKGPDYLVLNITHRQRLATPTAEAIGDPRDQAAYSTPTQVTFQVDCYGPGGGDIAQAVFSLLGTQHAADFFENQPLPIAPLQASEPQKIPFVNDQKQFEDRWVLQAILQANPVTTTVQEYADAVAVGLREVDTTYPP